MKFGGLVQKLQDFEDHLGVTFFGFHCITSIYERLISKLVNLSIPFTNRF